MTAKFALISTVDSMGPDFPSHCVMLFDTVEEAMKAAVEIIVLHDSDVVFSDGGWWMGGEFYRTVDAILDEWQMGLDSTEYFHLFPVQEVKL